MTEPGLPAPLDHAAWLAEFARLNRVIQSLRSSTARNVGAQNPDLGVLQRTILLEEQVNARTRDLRAALCENERAKRCLHESEAKLRALCDQSLAGIVVVENGKFSYTNATFDDIFGYDAVEIRDLGPVEVAAEDDRALVSRMVRTRTSGETDRRACVVRGVRKNGEVIDIECHSSVIDVGPSWVLVSLVMDVTARTVAARQVQDLRNLLREASTHDALTGLYNRRFLEESFGRDLLLAERSQFPVSVVMADLDRFKAVNDRHGRLAGDDVLRAFGDLLKGSARTGDLACRYGGQEFVLILPHLTHDGAAERAEGLRLALGDTVVLHGADEIRSITRAQARGASGCRACTPGSRAARRRGSAPRRGGARRTRRPRRGPEAPRATSRAPAASRRSRAARRCTSGDGPLRRGPTG